jgi:hypothetical protein
MESVTARENVAVQSHAETALPRQTRRAGNIPFESDRRYG